MKISLRVAAAALAVLAAATVGAAQYSGATYYRFSITGKYANGNADTQRNYQLSELALYDADGNRLTTTASLSPAANLEYAPAALLPGTYSMTRPFYAENHPTDMPDFPDPYVWKLFDGDFSTKTEQHCFLSNWTSASEEIGWLRYNIRLTNGAPAVASFNIGTGDDSLTANGGTRQPVSWRLEASADGVNWQTIYNVVFSEYVYSGSTPVYSNASWLNNGNPIPVTSQYDVSKFALTREVAVENGVTHRVEPKYFNFTVKSRYNPGARICDGVWGPDCFELRELALYDAGGARLNRNLSLASDPEAATTVLAAGEFSVTPKVTSSDPNRQTYSYYTPTGDNPWWSTTYVFDDNLGTGGFYNFSACHYLKPQLWFTYKMRLADDAAPVRAYNLAAGSMENNGQRTPAHWALQGSLDGVYYAPLAEEFNSPYVRLSENTWFNDGKPIATATPPVPAYGIQYTVKSGGTLALANETVFDTIHVLGGAVSVPDGAAAVWDVAKGDRLAIPGGGFTGAGEIVKTGGGNLAIGGENAFAGTVAVHGGTLAFTNASYAVDKKYFRLSIKKRYDGVPISSDNYKPMEIGEIALYDASGANVAQGLQFYGDSMEASAYDVPAGYFSLTPNHAEYRTDLNDGENPAKMFDGDTTTKGIFGCNGVNPETGKAWYASAEAWLNPNDESTWVRFNIHLPDSANPVVAYNICSGNDTVNMPTRAPYSWRLEASADGREWTVVDEMDDCSRFTTQNSTWFNGGRKFAVAWPSDVSSVPEAATFRVASGATLALSGSELTTFKIDCASRGTVRNLAMAQGGSVYFANFGGNTSADAHGSIALPFSVADSSLDNARLLSVNLYIDGVRSGKYRLALDNGVLSVKKTGLVILVH